MKLNLKKLELTCRKSVEVIDFSHISYFYGEMGAGKSTIARLIDYCLGSKDLVMTPALQSEFVSVALHLAVGSTELSIERERESGRAIVTWGDQQLAIPVRQADGVVLPATEVEVLSDLIFHLDGRKPPRVRKSQVRDDSDLERLSLRDLLWYCYLDQDSMDSSFFHLDRDADTYKRLKSRNVLRSILGVHQEKVAELEERLEEIRYHRLRHQESAKVLQDTLEEAKFSSLEEIEHRVKDAGEKADQIGKRIKSIRGEKSSLKSHVSDQLREKARQISTELEAIESTIEELTSTGLNDRRHLNEILSLSTKVRRLESARAVLNEVDFVKCPRCARDLPKRSPEDCEVCGQELASDEVDDREGEETQADIASRVSELNEMMEAQSTQVKRLRRRRDDLQFAKESVDDELVQAMQQYDSAYLAEAIEAEKRKAEIAEELKYLKKMKVLPQKVAELNKKADSLATDEATVRRELAAARTAAEKDLTNLQKLKELFLDCLLRAKIAGFEKTDIVSMKSPWFLPEVQGTSGELAITSFSTLGSGGKKNLFKCCFALAIHRLAAKLETLLPSLLIIDSPMKNISERENRPQFEGFHQLVYELSIGELKETQFILIDKEYCPPEQKSRAKVTSRHMRVNSKTEPPLIGYYRGK